MVALPRLPQSAQIVNPDATPSQQNQIWWDQVAGQLEKALTDVFTALATMPDVPNIHIQADYAGTANADQLPYTAQLYRYTGTTDDTRNATWSASFDSAKMSASVSNGSFLITAITATGDVTVTSTYNGVAVSRTFTVYLDNEETPLVTGTTVQDSSLTSMPLHSSTSTPVVLSDSLSVTVGATGNANLSAPAIKITMPAGSSPESGLNIKMKWQWFDTGTATWTDVGSEVSSSPDVRCGSLTVSGVTTTGHVTPGYITCNAQKTGLVAAAVETFRLVTRPSPLTNQATIAFLGVASVVSP